MQYKYKLRRKVEFGTKKSIWTYLCFSEQGLQIGHQQARDCIPGLCWKNRIGYKEDIAIMDKDMAREMLTRFKTLEGLRRHVYELEKVWI